MTCLSERFVVLLRAFSICFLAQSQQTTRSIFGNPASSERFGGSWFVRSFRLERRRRRAADDIVKPRQEQTKKPQTQSPFNFLEPPSRRRTPLRSGGLTGSRYRITSVVGADAQRRLDDERVDLLTHVWAGRPISEYNLDVWERALACGHNLRPDEALAIARAQHASTSSSRMELLQAALWSKQTSSSGKSAQCSSSSTSAEVESPAAGSPADGQAAGIPEDYHPLEDDSEDDQDQQRGIAEDHGHEHGRSSAKASSSQHSCPPERGVDQQPRNSVDAPGVVSDSVFWKFVILRWYHDVIAALRQGSRTRRVRFAKAFRKWQYARLNNVLDIEMNGSCSYESLTSPRGHSHTHHGEYHDYLHHQEDATEKKVFQSYLSSAAAKARTTSNRGGRELAGTHKAEESRIFLGSSRSTLEDMDLVSAIAASRATGATSQQVHDLVPRVLKIAGMPFISENEMAFWKSTFPSQQKTSEQLEELILGFLWGGLVLAQSDDLSGGRAGSARTSRVEGVDHHQPRLNNQGQTIPNSMIVTGLFDEQASRGQEQECGGAFPRGSNIPGMLNSRRSKQQHASSSMAGLTSTDGGRERNVDAAQRIRVLRLWLQDLCPDQGSSNLGGNHSQELCRIFLHTLVREVSPRTVWELLGWSLEPRFCLQLTLKTYQPIFNLYTDNRSVRALANCARHMGFVRDLTEHQQQALGIRTVHLDMPAKSISTSYSTGLPGSTKVLSFSSSSASTPNGLVSSSPLSSSSTAVSRSAASLRPASMLLHSMGWRSGASLVSMYQPNTSNSPPVVGSEQRSSSGTLECGWAEPLLSMGREALRRVAPSSLGEAVPFHSSSPASSVELSPGNAGVDQAPYLSTTPFAESPYPDVEDEASLPDAFSAVNSSGIERGT